MDAGSGINLIYARMLRAMCISLENLKPTDCSFHGIVPGATNYPLGKINNDDCYLIWTPYMWFIFYFIHYVKNMLTRLNRTVSAICHEPV
jgi:hypothetical protein